MPMPSRLPYLAIAPVAVLVTLGFYFAFEREGVYKNAKSPETEGPGTQLSIDQRLHKGIDVSFHSGSVDWTAVAAQEFTFAFLKATEGDDLRDPSFGSHWSEVKSAGMARGAYHFYVTEDDPDTQAQLFIGVVELEPGDLAPVVDIELIGHHTQPGLKARLKRWLDVVESHYGVKPIIYTSPKFWNEHLGPEFGDYPLWIAEYEVDEPKVPSGWSTWHLWQCVGDTSVPGVEKGADITRLNHEAIRFSELIVPPSGRDL
ncbi:MAG TPA: GH25 family lysozyme [candidate division Zixibacteria bacterium]